MGLTIATDEPMSIDQWITADKAEFAKQRETIRARLAGSSGILDHVGEDNKEEIFYMLCFVLLVPQSKQVLAEQAEKILRSKDFYEYPLSKEELAIIFKGKARFQNTKARRVHQARHVFLTTDFWPTLKDKFNAYRASTGKARDRILLQTRVWLDSKIDGMGFKLASHFMRNIGMRGLAILDSHVRDAMFHRYGIGNPGDQLSNSEYYAIETKVKEHAIKVGITLDELDLLLCGHSK